MAKITKDEKRLCTTAEAVSLVKNADGRVRFMVGVQVFLPTGDEMGFPGYSAMTVSRSQFLQIVSSVNKNFEARGGRIPLTLVAPRNEHSPAWIQL